MVDAGITIGWQTQATEGVNDMACPICQSDRFYVKDPSDPFEIYEFRCREGKVDFEDAATEEEAPAVDNDQEIYCQRCSWHGNVDSV